MAGSTGSGVRRQTRSPRSGTAQRGVQAVAWKHSAGSRLWGRSVTEEMGREGRNLKKDFGHARSNNGVRICFFFLKSNRNVHKR